MSDLKWGILGCGVIANEMAQAFEKMGRKVYGVSSRTQTKTEVFAEKYGVENVYGSYEEMLEDENIDVIYIATPHSQHYENMKKAIGAGKHILCEKAITVNDHQLEEIVSLAEEKNLTVREAMTISHMPLFKELKDRIDKGDIGTVKMVQVNFGSNKGYDSTNRFFALEAAGGALLDIGGYATTFARTFMDEAPNTILTTVQYVETGVDEQSGIILKNESDQMAVICLTIRAKQPKRGMLAFENGYVEIYDYPRAEKAVINYTEDTSQEVIECGSTKDALWYEVNDMEEAVSGAADEMHFDYTVDVMNVMTEIRKAWGLSYPEERESL